MARLTTKAKINRLHSQGFSDQQIADVTGFSRSSVGRVRRGQQSGEKIAAPLNEFFKLTKGAKGRAVSGEISLPSAKPATAIRARPSIVERIVSPLERAEGKLSQLDKDSMVVVRMTMKSTGRSRTLFAREGVEVSYLRQRGLKRAINEQAARQGRGNQGSISDPEIDWDDVVDIDIDEY